MRSNADANVNVAAGFLLTPEAGIGTASLTKSNPFVGDEVLIDV
jgi:hypothetical protein